METTRQRDVDPRDVSDRDQDSLVEEEEVVEEPMEVRLHRSVLGVGSKPRIKVPTYDGSLNAKECIDWINALDKTSKMCCHETKRTCISLVGCCTRRMKNTRKGKDQDWKPNLKVRSFQNIISFLCLER